MVYVTALVKCFALKVHPITASYHVYTDSVFLFKTCFLKWTGQDKYNKLILIKELFGELWDPWAAPLSQLA